MSVTALSALSLLPASLLVAHASAPTATLVAATSSASSTTTPLVNDLAALLKALAAGDVTGANAELTKVNQDLKTDPAAANSSSSPLNQLVDKIARDLSSGSTSASLQAVASSLVNLGHPEGAVVDTTA